MAEVQDKTINALDEATIINSEDITPIVQAVGSNYVTKKAELGDIGDHIATDMTFSDLQTTSKNLVGAINEASQNGGASEITELDDVNINSSTLANGDALVYDSASSKWVNGEVTPGAVDLSDLGDVAISSPSNDQVLKYNGTSGKWVNGTGGGGGASSLDDLSDVVISSPTANQVLKYDDVSGKWENAAESAGVSDLDDLTDVSISSPTDGQVLTYDSNSSTWVNSSGGSGSGGHIIVDSSGTDLAQRTNLQFIGAYSEDNSTDDTTEVNVIRNMTKAEFDLLSDDEKVGIINVTDITGNSENEFQPVVYSENEREIGVWTDGKPLYEKTIDCGTLPDNAEKTVAHGITNIDLIVETTGIAYSTSLGIAIPLSNAQTSTNSAYVIDYSVRSENVIITTYRDRTSYNGYVTFRYTKTTDQPGSGQWTPQGVPAVHYSEDEQVVGTWIDGSTVYERVFDLGTDVAIENTSFTNTAIDASSMNKIISVTGMYSTGVTNYPLMANINNNIIRLQSDRNGQTGASVRYIILRYTKAST